MNTSTRSHCCRFKCCLPLCQTATIVYPCFVLHGACRPTLAGLPAPQLAAHLVQVVLDAAGNSSHISLSLRELQQTTLTQYKASLSDLLMRVEMRDGERYTSVMCCDEIRISRSPPVMYRSIVAIECLKPQA